MAEVKINLGVRSYKIIIDVFKGNLVNTLMQEVQINQKVLIISDNTVGKLYGLQLIKDLQELGFTAELYCVPIGEQSKSLTVAMDLYTKAITLGLDRKSTIIALGGGIVGDLAGFVAATYLRGTPFIQIPTSLLAQVDSSVGGKVAINHPMGKNLIGAFYQPQIVVIDIDFLTTLPDRELFTGLAEVIKYGVIADKAFFAYLNENTQQILNKQSTILTEIVRRSCDIKAQVVEQDECESSIRAVLNFGHTIGHAIEANTNFNTYNHGEAVAIGMYGAALISKDLGLCSHRTVEAIKSTILKFNLPIHAPECNIDDLFKLLYRDKKVLNNQINWVLLDEIGHANICHQVPENVVKEVLSEIIKPTI